MMVLIKIVSLLVLIGAVIVLKLDLIDKQPAGITCLNIITIIVLAATMVTL